MTIQVQSVLALIPAYNESARIANVIRDALPHVATVVVIDDGSADTTAAVAEAAGATVIRHPQNRGKGAAIKTALDHLAQSDADAGIFLDADGQHDPAEIPLFIQAAQQQQAGVVVGNRLHNPVGMPALRLRTNQFTSWVTAKLARQPVPDSQCGYRLIHRSVLPDLHFQSERFETETETLIQAGHAGHKIANVPIRSIYDGQPSHIHPCRDTLRFLRLVARYSVR
jgi:glycosyltransferase involved in cell wall biosynthesis